MRSSNRWGHTLFNRRRRDFITLLGGAAAAWPLAARAQQPATVQKVGFLSDESLTWGSAAVKVFAKTLNELGFIEGPNIVFETRYAEGKDDLLPGFAVELVRMRVNLIVAVGTPATLAAKNATNSIPIVFSRIADPIALGLVTNLARPSGNLTGVSVIAPDLAAKRLEMLAEVIPGNKRVGVLFDPTFLPALLELKEIERAASILNIELERLGVQRAEELEAAVQHLVERHGQALLVAPGPLWTEQRKRIADIAIKSGLPTMLPRREHVEAGGLMSYAPNYSDMYRRAATYVGKILKGAKPSDLPVEQPTNVELVINLKTAKALGLTVPLTLQARADEVIE
jgi:putative tryptophan/tyrosine transport system substrate-binding protein